MWIPYAADEYDIEPFIFMNFLEAYIYALTSGWLFFYCIAYWAYEVCHKSQYSFQSPCVSVTGASMGVDACRFNCVRPSCDRHSVWITPCSLTPIESSSGATPLIIHDFTLLEQVSSGATSRVRTAHALQINVRWGERVRLFSAPKHFSNWDTNFQEPC